jgi:hypothetical protein
VDPHLASQQSEAPQPPPPPPPQDPEAKQLHALLSRLNPRQQGLHDPDPDARGLLALRLLILLPNCQMRLRALASMRKVPAAVRATAAALLEPEVSVGADPSACD